MWYNGGMGTKRPTLEDGRAYAAAHGYRVVGGGGPHIGQCIIDAVDYAERTPGTGTAFSQYKPGHGVKPSGARVERVS